MTDPDTPLAAALADVGDRWKLHVIDALMSGPARFSDLEQAVAGISTNVLSARLKELEHSGLVTAEAYSERPPRYQYALTASGRELSGVLRLLADWAGRHGDEPATPRHDLCGTPLEARWYCPTCDIEADASEPTWRV